MGQKGIYPVWRSLQDRQQRKTAVRMGEESFAFSHCLRDFSNSHFLFFYYVFNKQKGSFLALSIEA